MLRRISISSVLCVVCILLAMHEPRYIHDCVPLGHVLFKVTRTAAVILVIGKFLLDGDCRLNGMLKCFFAFFIWVMADCWVLHPPSDVVPMIMTLMNAVASLLLVEIFIKRRQGEFIMGAFVAYSIWVGANLMTMIRSPEGLYVAEGSMGIDITENWFLGFKNGLHEYCLMLSLFALFLPLRKAWRTLALALSLGVFLATAAIGQSGTGLVCCGIFTLSVLGIGILKRIRLDARWVFPVYVLAFGLLMSLTNSDLIADFAELLGKDVTFTGRTNIWEVTLGKIAECPVIGFGWIDPILRTEMVADAEGAVNAHNTILELLFTYGAIGLLLYGSGVVRALMRIGRNPDNRVAVGLFAVVICMMPITLVEAKIFNLHFFILYSLAWNNSYLKLSEAKEKET